LKKQINPKNQPIKQRKGESGLRASLEHQKAYN